VAKDEYAPHVVFEDQVLRVEHCLSCTVPGYLIVQPQSPVPSLAWLDPEVSRVLGLMLSRAVRAIEVVVEPEQVYCLLFGEDQGPVHFHLFPRTDWLLERYRADNPIAGPAISGAQVFDWARETFTQGTPLPPGAPTVDEVCTALRTAILDV
jgi:diadenosine tetraphosphate (Ap4A) HIT family hydrolase